MKIIQKIDLGKDNISIHRDSFLIVSATQHEWDFLSSLCGQNESFKETEEIDIFKANRTLRHLSDAKIKLQLMLKELDKYADKDDSRK